MVARLLGRERAEGGRRGGGARLLRARFPALRARLGPGHRVLRAGVARQPDARPTRTRCRCCGCRPIWCVPSSASSTPTSRAGASPAASPARCWCPISPAARSRPARSTGRIWRCSGCKARSTPFSCKSRGPGGWSWTTAQVVRVTYAGQNGRKYVAIGKLLQAQGAIPAGQVTMQSIRAWLAAHPEQGRAVMDEDPSYVFFKEVRGLAPDDGPPGTLGASLTPGRSVAVDPGVVPLGAPLWLDTTDPTTGKPWHGMVVAQDTGGAVKGRGRMDLFFGWGAQAAQAAGRMQAQGQSYVLLPAVAGRRRGRPRERDGRSDRAAHASLRRLHRGAGGVVTSLVDVVVTSPPYNLDLAYRHYADRRPEAEYLDWMVAVAAALKRVLKPDGSFFLNIARLLQPALAAVRADRAAAAALRAAEPHRLGEGDHAPAMTASGTTSRSPGERFLHHMHEHVFHLTHEGDVQLDRLAIGVPFKDKSNIARRGHAAGPALPRQHLVHPLSDGAEPGGEIRPSRHLPARPAALVHPPARPADAVVLDPFAGTGTTLLAASWRGARHRHRDRPELRRDRPRAAVGPAEECRCWRLKALTLEWLDARAAPRRAVRHLPGRSAPPDRGLRRDPAAGGGRLPGGGAAGADLLRPARLQFRRPRHDAPISRAAPRCVRRLRLRGGALGFLRRNAAHHLPHLFDDDPNLRARADALAARTYELVSFPDRRAWDGARAGAHIAAA